MSSRARRIGVRAALIVLLLSAFCLLPAAIPAPQQGGPPPGSPSPPPPSAAHAVLHRLIGEWTARMEVGSDDGGKPEKVRATEVVRSCCAGMFVLADLRGKAKKMPHGGQAILGYDPARGRYILTWADSRSTSLAIGEGELDEAGDSLTFLYERPDGNGGARQVRDRFTWDGDQRRSRTISIVREDGSTSPMVTIRYRRK